MAKQPKPPGKPVGQALEWSDEEIDRLATITPEDIAAAKSHAERLMPKRVKPLLKAKKRNGRDAGSASQ